MAGSWKERVVTVDTAVPVWDRFFTVAPLVVIGTREGDGFDLAPKHMAGPVGWENHFGFTCSPRHATYVNAREHGFFTVSYPKPRDLLLASLAAAPRCDEGTKESLEVLPTTPATVIDGVFLEDSSIFLECELFQVVDDLGPNSLMIGRVLAAHVDRGALRESESDDGALIAETPLLVYVSPGRYAVVSETRAFPFPADFKR